MIEKVLFDYLSDALPGVPVKMERPDKPPKRMVLIEKTGSSRNNRIESATVAIQSYAPSMFGAAELNQQVKAAMDNIVQLDSVARCELNSDYNYTDLNRKEYRYQAVYDLVHYE